MVAFLFWFSCFWLKAVMRFRSKQAVAILVIYVFDVLIADYARCPRHLAVMLPLNISGCCPWHPYSPSSCTIFPKLRETDSHACELRLVDKVSDILPATSSEWGYLALMPSLFRALRKSAFGDQNHTACSADPLSGDAPNQCPCYTSVGTG